MSKTVEILLIEDNPGDIRLTMEAFKEGRVLNNLTVAKDGEEALDRLYNRGIYTENYLPDMILLDLNLPRKDGREVLKIIKSDEFLKRVPVVILTTSKVEEDIVRSYNSHANCFITKPIDMNHFMEVIRLVEEFWFKVVRLPSRT
jgi:CheY-like chemotaxis protein